MVDIISKGAPRNLASYPGPPARRERAWYSLFAYAQNLNLKLEEACAFNVRNRKSMQNVYSLAVHVCTCIGPCSCYLRLRVRSTSHNRVSIHWCQLPFQQTRGWPLKHACVFASCAGQRQVTTTPSPCSVSEVLRKIGPLGSAISYSLIWLLPWMVSFHSSAQSDVGTYSAWRR